MLKRQEEPVVFVSTIKHIPIQVDLSHLDENNHLRTSTLAKDQMDAYIEKIPYHSKMLKIPKAEIARLGANAVFSLIVDQYREQYVIYDGKKKNRALGSGESGTAKLVQRVSDGEWFVLKVSTDETRKNIKEMQMLIKMSLGLYFQLEHVKKQHENQDPELRNLLLMRYARGVELVNVTDRPRVILNPIQYLDIALSVLEGIKDLQQQKKILHRDLKGQNIMLDIVNSETKFVDAGMAEEMQDGTFTDTARVGTPANMAPELDPFQDKEDLADSYTYSVCTEMYAVGNLLKELFGFEIKLPVDAPEFDDLEPMVPAESRFPGDELNGLIVALLKLTDKMTEDKPEDRMLVDEAISTIAQLKANYAKDMPPKKIAVVNVKDLQRAVKDKKVLEVLSGYDEVLMIGDLNEGMNPEEVAHLYRMNERLVHDLLVAHVKCRDTFYQSNNKEVLLLRIKHDHVYANVEKVDVRKLHLGVHVSPTKRPAPALSPRTQAERGKSSEFYQIPTDPQNKTENENNGKKIEKKVKRRL